MSHSRVWFKRDLRLRERLAVMFPGFYPKLQTRAGITGNITVAENDAGNATTVRVQVVLRQRTTRASRSS